MSSSQLFLQRIWALVHIWRVEIGMNPMEAAEYRNLQRAAHGGMKNSLTVEYGGMHNSFFLTF